MGARCGHQAPSPQAYTIVCHVSCVTLLHYEHGMTTFGCILVQVECTQTLAYARTMIC